MGYTDREIEEWRNHERAQRHRHYDTETEELIALRRLLKETLELAQYIEVKIERIRNDLCPPWCEHKVPTVDAVKVSVS
jgi:hypothetical protein